jgi:hypothetical protein
MTAVRPYVIVALCWTSVITVLASGCTVGAKSFSMDSTSRMPFFGLELKERKPKSAVPSFNSISRSVPAGGAVNPSVRPLAPTSKGPYKSIDGRFVADNDTYVRRAGVADVVVAPEVSKPRSIPSTPFPAADGRAPQTRPAPDQLIDFQ